MATTIARLAAVLSLDDARLRDGLKRAGVGLKELDNNVSGSSNILTRLSQRLIISSGSLGRFGGIAAFIGGAGGPIGLITVALIAATAAAAALAIKLAMIGDAARDAKLEGLRDLFKAEDALRGTKFSSGPQGQTTKELIADLKQGLSDFAEGLGLSLQPFLMALNDMVQITLEDLLGKDVADGLKKSREDLAKMVQHTKELRAERARLESRAESLRVSLRLPDEVMRDAFTELDRLKQVGLITSETFGRGISRAADEYRAAAKKLMEVKSSMSPTAALERGTVAEFSARQRGSIELKEIERTNKAQLATEKLILDELKKLGNKPTTTLKLGRLKP